MPETITLTRDIVTDTLIEGETGRIFLITRTRLLDADGNKVSEQVHRRPIEPDADVRTESPEVKALAPIVRTPERLARYEAAVAVEPDIREVPAGPVR